MLYKFKSKATGDVIMTTPAGDAVLRAMGREPASKGIFEAAALPALIDALTSAIAAENASGETQNEIAPGSDRANTKKDSVTLRQRAWPLLEMMKQAAAGKLDVVWGA